MELWEGSSGSNGGTLAEGVKAWINQALEKTKPSVPITAESPSLAHGSAAISKLRAIAEDVARARADTNQAIELTTTLALQNIPKSVKAINQARIKAVELKKWVATIEAQLCKVEGKTARAVAFLAELDTVKQRMEACVDTIQKAESMTRTMQELEHMFQSPSAAECLQISVRLEEMAASQKVLAKLPQFSNAHERLHELQDRLEAMCIEDVSTAIDHYDTGATQSYISIFEKLNRMDVVYDRYFARRCATGGALWARHLREGRAISAWLPAFYDDFLRMLTREVHWISSAFPDTVLLPELVKRLFTSAAHDMTAAVRASLAAPARKELSALSLLADMHGATVTFASNIHSLLSEYATGPNTTPINAAVGAVLAPFDALLQEYTKLERTQLMSELAACTNWDASDLERCVDLADASVEKVFGAVGKSLLRCVALTDGAELEALVGVVADIFSEHISRLCSLIKRLRSLSGFSDSSVSSSSSSSVEHNRMVLQGGLRLLGVCYGMGLKLSECEATFRSSLLAVKSVWLPAPAAAPCIRLLSPYMESKKPRMVALIKAWESPEPVSIFNSTTRSLWFVRRLMQTFVYDAMLDTPRRCLTSLPAMEVWRAGPPEAVVRGGEKLEMPTFGAYPQACVIEVGEHLLGLPTHLEQFVPGEALRLSATATQALLAGRRDSTVDSGEFLPERSAITTKEEDGGEGEVFYGKWVEAVGYGVVQLLQECVARIPALSDVGCQQLEADIAYLESILATLVEVVDGSLAHIRSLLVMPPADLQHLALERGGGGGGGGGGSGGGEVQLSSFGGGGLVNAKTIASARGLLT